MKNKEEINRLEDIKKNFHLEKSQKFGRFLLNVLILLWIIIYISTCIIRNFIITFPSNSTIFNRFFFLIGDCITSPPAFLFFISLCIVSGYAFYILYILIKTIKEDYLILKNREE